MNEFRSIYMIGNDWLSPHLSGVGVKTQTPTLNYIAPRDPEVRYDDDYEVKGEDWKISIFPMAPLYSNYSSSQFHQHPWGYFFHETCWQLLSSACLPHSIDLKTLNNFCRSCVLGDSWVHDWGHDYGGIMGTITDERTGINPMIAYLKSADNVKALYQANPLDIPGLKTWMNEARMDAGSVDRSSVISDSDDEQPQPQPSIDPFYQLPVEMREMILSLLPSKDVEETRVASQAFGSLTLPQSFWHTRFFPGFEYSLIVEANDMPSGSYDWKSIYARLQRPIEDPGIRNRIRVWSLLSPLANAIVAYSKTRLYGSPYPTFYEKATDESLEKGYQEGQRSVGGITTNARQRLHFGGRHIYWKSVV